MRRPNSRKQGVVYNYKHLLLAMQCGFLTFSLISTLQALTLAAGLIGLGVSIGVAVVLRYTPLVGDDAVDFINHTLLMLLGLAVVSTMVFTYGQGAITHPQLIKVLTEAWQLQQNGLTYLFERFLQIILLL